MSYQEFVGCIYRGPAADRPTWAAYMEGFVYEATDTGDVWYANASAWVQLQGAEKQEILKNKTINYADNTVPGLQRDVFASNKRLGYIIPAPTADASLQLALKGMPGVGAYTLEYDATQGYYCRFQSVVAERFGWFSTALPIKTRREHAPRLKIRSRTPVNGNLGYWIGFSNTTPQLSHTPFPNGAHFFVVGMSPSFSTKFVILRNDGTNDSGLANQIDVLKSAATNWNDFEITMSDTDITTKINSVELTASVRIPALSTDLYVMIFCYNSEAVIKNLDVVKGYFESDFV